MELLTKNFLWMRTLGSTPMLEAENRQRFPERVRGVAEKVRSLDASSVVGVATAGIGAGMATPEAARQRRGIAVAGGTRVGAEKGKDTKEDSELDKVCQGVVELATEKLHGNIVQVTKKNLFC